MSNEIKWKLNNYFKKIMYDGCTTYQMVRIIKCDGIDHKDDELFLVGSL
jgi:hypothetical protein